MIDPADGGFLDQVLRNMPSERDQSLLPRSCDRYAEAVHFLQLVKGVEPIPTNVRRANWYAGAHVAAVSGLSELVKIDVQHLGRKDQKQLPLVRERFLTTDSSDPLERDPIGVNRAYVELRTLHVHFGEPIVVAEARRLVVDAGVSQEEIRTRWYLRPLRPPAVGAFKTPQLTPKEREQFNDYSACRAFEQIAGQQLMTLGIALRETCEAL
jgi:hypothetical protein